MLGFNWSWRVRIVSSIAAAIAGGWVSTAAAQGGDAALAESLFREGKRLSGEHKYAEACPKFQESYRLDHGLGTLLNLASCHESEGKPASAWAEFSEAMAQAKRQGDADRAQLADEHMHALEPKLAHVSIGVAPGANVAGLIVKFDARELSAAALGVQIPVDPGRHLLEASAPGKRPYSQTFDTTAAATVLAVTVPALQDAPTDVPPVVGNATQATPETSSLPANVPVQPATTGNPSSKTGLVVSGVATGVFAVGAVVTAIVYSSKRNDFKTANDARDETRFDKRDSAQTIGTVNLILTGGTLLSAAFLGYFLITGGSQEQAPASTARVRIEPLVAPSGAGLLVRGAL